MASDPHADSPVFLTLAGADAAKVLPMVRALTEIGELAAASPVERMAYDLGKIVGIAIVTLQAVGELDSAAHLAGTLYGAKGDAGLRDVCADQPPAA